jgi:response regulator RpfG family c-di-GMP phosphodiesterase
MDCQMPVMDGFEATRTIRRWEQENARSRLPIVALTAGAFDEDRRNCIEAGMDDFLTKPIAINELTAMLERWHFGQPKGTRAMPQDDTPKQDSPPPVFDEHVLLTQLGNDRELAKTIVMSAMEGLPGYFTQLEHAVATDHWKDAERLTHTMKGLTAQIGGALLSGQLKAVDDRLKGGEEIDSATVESLRDAYRMLSAKLLEWLG